MATNGIKGVVSKANDYFNKKIKPDQIRKKVNEKLPDIGKQPNYIYSNWIKAGLQPDKFQTKEELFEVLKEILNTKKGKKAKQIPLAEALELVFPDGYEGLPLKMNYSGSISGGTRKVNSVGFDERRFRELIPLEVKDWFKLQESEGLFPKGSLERYEKYITKGNERNRKIAKRLSELTGIKFDKGHIFALFSKHGQGGSHDPSSQIAELLSENRGKTIDNLTGNIGSIIDTPPNWQQSAFEFVNRELGGKSGSQLPVDINTGKSLSQTELANIARRGADPNQVVASRWKAVHDALSEAEIAKANNTIPDFVNKFSKKIDPKTGKYIQSFGSGTPKVSQEILGVVKPEQILATTAKELAENGNHVVNGVNGGNGGNGGNGVIKNGVTNITDKLGAAKTIARKTLDNPAVSGTLKVSKYGLIYGSLASTSLLALSARTRAAENPTLKNKIIANLRTAEATLDATGLGLAATGVGLPLSVPVELTSMGIGMATDLGEYLTSDDYKEDVEETFFTTL